MHSALVTPLRRVSAFAWIAGATGGTAFVIGWLANPSPQATLAVTFVCGLSTALNQLGTRDLLAKAQGLVDRGADESIRDGGQLLSDARRLRARVEALALDPVIAGVIAPACATLGTMFLHPLWAALAFSASTVALLSAGLLFKANRQLTQLLERDRTERAHAKHMAEIGAQIKPTDRSKAPSDPNLMGYGMGGTAKEVSPNQH